MLLGVSLVAQLRLLLIYKGCLRSHVIGRIAPESTMLLRTVAIWSIARGLIATLLLWLTVLHPALLWVAVAFLVLCWTNLLTGTLILLSLIVFGANPVLRLRGRLPRSARSQHISEGTLAMDDHRKLNQDPLNQVCKAHLLSLGEPVEEYELHSLQLLLWGLAAGAVPLRRDISERVELAAGRLGVLPPTEIADWLYQNGPDERRLSAMALASTTPAGAALLLADSLIARLDEAS